METYKERFLAIIEESGLNNSAFAKKLGMKPAALYNYIRENSSTPSADIIAKISLEFPQFNIVWFLTGQGEMYNAGFERPKKNDGSEGVEELRAMVESMRVEIDNLQKSMRWLMNQLNVPKSDFPIEVGKAKAKQDVLTRSMYVELKPATLY
jgi:transcriptional regulator with XRE-family HTH domain